MYREKEQEIKGGKLHICIGTYILYMNSDIYYALYSLKYMLAFQPLYNSFLAYILCDDIIFSVGYTQICFYYIHT